MISTKKVNTNPSKIPTAKLYFNMQNTYSYIIFEKMINFIPCKQSKKEGSKFNSKKNPHTPVYVSKNLSVCSKITLLKKFAGLDARAVLIDPILPVFG